jgi:uncharacterized protein (DUF58 family)
MSVTGLAGMYNIKKMFPDLHPPGEVFAGIPAPFRLSVRNSKRYLPSFLISVECFDGQSLVFPVVQQNSIAYGNVMLLFNRRGEVALGKISISSPYPVGFFTRFWVYEIVSKVTVFPHPVANNYVAAAEDSPASGSGLRRSRGLSGELERIYPYSGSEPLRMIHWKHSARSQDLLVKGFGTTVASPLIINLESLPGQGVEERLSHATWLVQRWVRERPVGLQLDGRLYQSGMGKQHGLMLLRELALYGSN